MIFIIIDDLNHHDLMIMIRTDVRKLQDVRSHEAGVNIVLTNPDILQVHFNINIIININININMIIFFSDEHLHLHLLAVQRRGRRRRGEQSGTNLVQVSYDDGEDDEDDGEDDDDDGEDEDDDG